MSKRKYLFWSWNFNQFRAEITFKWIVRTSLFFWILSIPSISGWKSSTTSRRMEQMNDDSEICIFTFQNWGPLKSCNDTVQSHLNDVNCRFVIANPFFAIFTYLRVFGIPVFPLIFLLCNKASLGGLGINIQKKAKNDFKA